MEEFVVPLDQQQNGSTESATDEQQVLEDQQPTASQASGRHNVRDPPITSNLFLHIGTRLSSERISGSEDLSQGTFSSRKFTSSFIVRLLLLLYQTSFFFHEKIRGGFWKMKRVKSV